MPASGVAVDTQQEEFDPNASYEPEEVASDQSNFIVPTPDEEDLLPAAGEVFEDTSSAPSPTATASYTRPRTTVVVKANPIAITFFDNGNVKGDGDAVDVWVNGVYKTTVFLTLAPDTRYFILSPGVNTIMVRCLTVGATGPCTAGWYLNITQVLAGPTQFSKAFTVPGQFTSFTAGFPIIRFPRSRYPEASAHAADAQRLGYARLVTIDRPGADRRRYLSVKAYKDNSSNPRTTSGQDYDEYPPAMFLENRGAGHVRPIASGDNRAQGASMGWQYHPLSNTDMAELVVTP